MVNFIIGVFIGFAICSLLVQISLNIRNRAKKSESPPESPEIGATYVLGGNPFKEVTAEVLEVRQGWVKYQRRNEVSVDSMECEAFMRIYKKAING